MGTVSVGAEARSLPGVNERDALVLPDHPDRRVALAGAFNFRDLGGYLGIDGRPVRWRTLYRADALHRLDDDELDVLGRLGVRSVLDLRTAGEVAKGRIHADRLGIVHHHLPVLDETWAPAELPADADAGMVLGSLYIQMLDVGAPALGGALRLLAEAPSLPAVFHCAAGKDRTGVLAALVLGLLGVPDEVIVADYALTAAAMERLKERLAVDAPESLTAMNDQPSAYLAAPAEAMERFLRHVDEAFGSMEGYARTIGADADLVAELRGRLLDAV
jgi:protein-tyrosine phosphatase